MDKTNKAFLKIKKLILSNGSIGEIVEVLDAIKQPSAKSNISKTINLTPENYYDLIKYMIKNSYALEDIKVLIFNSDSILTDQMYGNKILYLLINQGPDFYAVENVLELINLGASTKFIPLNSKHPLLTHMLTNGFSFEDMLCIAEKFPNLLLDVDPTEKQNLFFFFDLNTKSSLIKTALRLIKKEDLKHVINLKDKNGDTILHSFIRDAFSYKNFDTTHRSCLSTVKTFISFGADPEIKNNNNESPLDISLSLDKNTYIFLLKCKLKNDKKFLNKNLNFKKSQNDNNKYCSKKFL